MVPSSTGARDTRARCARPSVSGWRTTAAVRRIAWDARSKWDKCERYCREQRTLLRDLEDLMAREQTMHEIDNGKDQVMTVMKLALANLS